MRIHILVALGAATFVLALLETIPNADQGAISQVIQGVATGVGFLGAGAILQNRNEERIDGMTAAATIWLAAAVGMAVGLGRLWLPLLGIVVWLAAVGLHWLHETGRFAWLRKLLKRVKFW
jgi:putative Mg2+ transporter-C (MgtC) family protein